jgi:hypothetical protein
MRWASFMLVLASLLLAAGCCTAPRRSVLLASAVPVPRAVAMREETPEEEDDEDDEGTDMALERAEWFATVVSVSVEAKRTLTSPPVSALAVFPTIEKDIYTAWSPGSRYVVPQELDGATLMCNVEMSVAAPPEGTPEDEECSGVLLVNNQAAAISRDTLPKENPVGFLNVFKACRLAVGDIVSFELAFTSPTLVYGGEGCGMNLSRVGADGE